MDPVLTKLIVIFSCSMIAAVVLFKYVGATAKVDGEGAGGFGLKVFGFQAGGSIAGFLLVYGLMHYSFERLVAASPPPVEPVRWTIKGTVQDANALRVGKVDVTVQPPEQDTTGTTGTFRITNVVALTQGEFPKIQFPELLLDHKPGSRDKIQYYFDPVVIQNFKPKATNKNTIQLQKPIVPIFAQPINATLEESQ